MTRKKVTQEERLDKVVAFLKKNEKATSHEIAMANDMSVGYVQNLLCFLRRNACVERILESKKPMWKFLKERPPQARLRSTEAVIKSRQKIAKKEQEALDASKLAAEAMRFATKQTLLKMGFA